MNEQDRLNHKYMTGWEVIASIIAFSLMGGLAWLFLLITY
jgi:hypothetical protein